MQPNAQKIASLSLFHKISYIFRFAIGTKI